MTLERDREQHLLLQIHARQIGVFVIRATLHGARVLDRGVNQGPREKLHNVHRRSIRGKSLCR